VAAVGSCFFVYILANQNNTVLYTGVTNNLPRRIQEHKSGEGGAFTKKYNVHKLVYFETLHQAVSAIEREKQIKGGSRQRKAELITKSNPNWLDLSDDPSFILL
jgi:putative endonuclease